MAKIGKRVKIDNFAEAVQEALTEFAGYIDSTVVEAAVTKTAAETAEIVRNAAPVKTGEYKNSITHGERRRAGHQYTETVYAESPDYRLTHLLEKGHATRNGGRTRAFPHWQTGENGIGERLVSNFREAMK